MSGAIAESNWRNFKPIAPVLDVDVYRGVPFDISLKEYLVQGARDLETGEKDQAVLDAIQAQRGWLCNYFNISRPKHGKLENSIYGDGFRFTSLPNYIGPDCFSYVMNMGTQNSEPGMIRLNIKDYVSARIVVEEDTSRRTDTKRAFRYILQWYMPPSIGDFDRVLATWYVERPERFTMNGKNYVRIVKEQVAKTRMVSVTYRPLGFTYVEQHWRYPEDGSFIEYEWPDAGLAASTDVNTGLPYRQIPGPWPISVDVSFRNFKTTKYIVWATPRYRNEWTDIENISVDVRDLMGNDWWRSGLIQDVNDPNFTPQSPSKYTPDIIDGNTPDQEE